MMFFSCHMHLVRTTLAAESFFLQEFVIDHTSMDFHEFSWILDAFNMFSCQLSSQRLAGGPTTTSPRRPLGGMPPGAKECAEICGMHLEEAR